MDGSLAARASGCFGKANPVEGATVTGWVVSTPNGTSASQVVAFIDGEPAGHAVVGPPGDGSGVLPDAAGTFSYAIPLQFQDGRSHLLSLVLADGSAVEFPTRSGLGRSNLRFRFEGSGETPAREPLPLPGPAPEQDVARYAGGADPFAGATITGWAVSRAAPGEPVRLRVYIDGVSAGAVDCDRPHDALRALGLPNATGGFVYTIPEGYRNGVTHSLAILFEDASTLPFRGPDGRVVSRMEFTAEPTTSIEGVVDGLHGESIRGWAIRKHHRTGESEGHVLIQVLCNGVALSELVADLPRMDVAREYHCDPDVGFEFRLPPQFRNGLEFEFVFKALPEGEELAGCPLPVRHRPPDGADELRGLANTVGDLCATAFRLQRQVRDLVPVADATVVNYDGWARRYLARLRARMALADPLPEDAPLVSVVMPTFRTNLAHLTAAIESVRAQSYTNWQLIIVDDGSGEPALAACLRNYALADERITCVLSRRNRGISKATNAGLQRARGTYVVFFDHDDQMVEVALELMVREALRCGAKIIYSDEDKIDEFGVLSEPNLKPDWNYRLLLGVNYICHLLMFERILLRRTGLLRSGCDGAQDHDLLLRLCEHCHPDRIRHVPEILYHWRKSASSTATSKEAKPYAIEAGRRAVADHLARRGFDRCQVSSIASSTTFSVSWGFTGQPSVTIIVPFKDQVACTRRCLDALLAHTEWDNWQVVLIDNGSVTPEAAEFSREAAASQRVTMLRIEEPFNYARLNNIAARAHPADYYVFLNNDVFLEQANWLRVLMDEALADHRAAIVGAKLLYPNGTVQHGGVVLGVGGVADHAFRGIPADHPGYLGRARLAQQYSAVTAACMLCRADVFMDLGGFDERELTVAFNDVDLCLKAGSRGWRVLWTPDLVAEHHESLSRGDDISAGRAQRFFYENQVMLQRWGGILPQDPFYSPHFSRDRGIFTDLA